MQKSNGVHFNVDLDIAYNCVCVTRVTRLLLYLRYGSYSLDGLTLYPNRTSLNE